MPYINYSIQFFHNPNLINELFFNNNTYLVLTPTRSEPIKT